MKKTLLAVMAALFISSVAYAADGAHWGYTGKEAPENWAKLSPEFSDCAGKNQSPINLTDFIDAQLNPLKFDYKAGGNEVVNNGHTIQVNYAPGSTVTIDGKVFELKQFHFHAPSENQINGKSFPFEAHLVHMDQNGNIAVIGIMYTEGKENKALAEFWSLIPENAGDSKKLEKIVDASLLLPAEQSYYRFNGSLTTPPCTEGVLWILFKESVSISKEQVEKFAKIMKHPNNRPVQPVNARPVLQ